jgi:hypothetical protein
VDGLDGGLQKYSLRFGSDVLVIAGRKWLLQN